MRPATESQHRPRKLASVHSLCSARRTLRSMESSSTECRALQVGYGDINLTTTGMNYPMLAGNLASILISAAVCTIVSLVKPDNFDWQATRQIKMVEQEDTGGLPHQTNH